MESYKSRKFIITTGTLIATVALAYLGKLDNPTSLVLVAIIAAYNYANVRAKEHEQRD